MLTIEGDVLAGFYCYVTNVDEIKLGYIIYGLHSEKNSSNLIMTVFFAEQRHGWENSTFACAFSICVHLLLK